MIIPLDRVAARKRYFNGELSEQMLVHDKAGTYLSEKLVGVIQSRATLGQRRRCAS
jgi:hypothetical protein